MTQLIKTGAALAPIDAAGKRKIDKIGEGEIVFADIQEARNYQQLKLFWATCAAIAANHKKEIYEGLDTARKVAEFVKLKIEFVDYRIVIKDRVHIKTKSISYMKCSQDEFKKFLDEAMPVLESLIDYKISDIDYSQYENEIADDQ